MVISRYGCLRSGAAGFVQNRGSTFPPGGGFSAGLFSALHGGSGLFGLLLPPGKRPAPGPVIIAVRSLCTMLLFVSSIFRIGEPTKSGRIGVPSRRAVGYTAS